MGSSFRATGLLCLFASQGNLGDVSPLVLVLFFTQGAAAATARLLAAGGSERDVPQGGTVAWAFFFDAQGGIGAPRS